MNLYQGDSGPVAMGVQVNPRTGSRLKAELSCDGVPLPPASPRFARHNHNHLGKSLVYSKMDVSCFNPASI